MDFALPGPDDARRAAVRDWLDAHLSPTPRQLAAAGLLAPHWPAPWGLGADPLHRLLVDEELDRAGVVRPDNEIGVGWAGPTIIHGGTDAQKARYLLPMLAGEERWCQLFSEPDAGSDLAALRTRAVRDGDVYVVTGQKIWSTWADTSAFGILLARTDPDAPKHRGISYLICPMDLPGITVRPIREMTGEHHFNEVFLDGVRIPAGHLVGEENRGWSLAKVTLANERVSLSRGGVCWSMGPTTADLFDLVRARGGIADPQLRQRAATAYTQAEILRLLDVRILSAAAAGRPPGPEASIKKILADEHGQRVMELAKDLAGAAGMLDDTGPLGAAVARWHWGFLFSRALTIGGGTGEVQRNIVAERVLGLPGEVAA